jgi:hypothetical protein
VSICVSLLCLPPTFEEVTDNVALRKERLDLCALDRISVVVENLDVK